MGEDKQHEVKWGYILSIEVWEEHYSERKHNVLYIREENVIQKVDNCRDIGIIMQGDGFFITY